MKLRRFERRYANTLRKETPMRQSLKYPAVGTNFSEWDLHGVLHSWYSGACRRR